MRCCKNSSEKRHVFFLNLLFVYLLLYLLHSSFSLHLYRNGFVCFFLNHWRESQRHLVPRVSSINSDRIGDGKLMNQLSSALCRFDLVSCLFCPLQRFLSWSHTQSWISHCPINSFWYSSRVVLAVRVLSIIMLYQDSIRQTWPRGHAACRIWWGF